MTCCGLGFEDAGKKVKNTRAENHPAGCFCQKVGNRSCSRAHFSKLGWGGVGIIPTVSLATLHDLGSIFTAHPYTYSDLRTHSSSMDVCKPTSASTIYFALTEKLNDEKTNWTDTWAKIGTMSVQEPANNLSYIGELRKNRWLGEEMWYGSVFQDQLVKHVYTYLYWECCCQHVGKTND